ncbi:PfkB family carbohydrate kinase [Olsenella urininfantis]|uniref:PfkB family carbohydrate kinase n=1 Tax=Olsenella urininfantis TaxID=1871033 RepID=UPI00117C603F|nr:PfkB family carbohydrate kinase [Olsenella urininfantis]
MDIKEIARLAGVSPATVSKVINRKDESISERTRKKVLETVRQHHYVPYSSNASKQNASWTICVVLREPVSSDSMLDGIIRAAQGRGYVVTVFDSYSSLEQERANIDAACASGCAGVIWEQVGEQSAALLPKLEKHGVSCLPIGVYGGEGSLLQPYFNAAYRMCLELVSLGHTRLGCLLSRGRRTEEFLAGYRRCLEEHGIAFRQELVFEEVGRDLAQAVATHEVTAVVSSHFRSATQFSQLMGTLRHQIPLDVSLVSLCNDNTSTLVNLDGVEISTCSIHNADYGSFLCDKLLAAIEGEEEPPPFEQSFELDNSSTVAVPSREGNEKVLVVGSLHADSYMLMPTLPRGGVTTSAKESQTCPGGKAANQAVGVAKLGHRVAVVGNVGCDLDADSFYREFKRWGVHSTGVHRVQNLGTGKALIFTDQRGESMISILSGANSTLSASEIRNRAAEFEDARLCLVQTEIPLAAVREACLMARERNIPTILKPSSCSELPDDILALVDYLVPNERELDDILPGTGDLRTKARSLLERGPRAVIVTLGDRGCLLCARDEERYYPACNFRAVDDTGACDAFISALSSYLLYGSSLDQAIRIASYAAGYSITKYGVIPSLIDRFNLEIAISDGSVGQTRA